jgi:hypothetical protein
MSNEPKVTFVGKEPKVKLPDPPVGKLWQYVGKGVAFAGDCAFWKEEWDEVEIAGFSIGSHSLHYWKAVSTELTTEQKLSIAIKALKKARGWAVADEALRKIL